MRMKYPKAVWSSMYFDDNGDLLMNKTGEDENIRTINNVILTPNGLSAYCNKTKAQRTFKFDRIGEIEILDI